MIKLTWNEILWERLAFFMNEKMNDLLQKVRAGAAAAGDFAVKTANSAGKKATEVFNVSKLNLAIFDLNNDVNTLYKEIGRMIYLSHRNEDTSAELLQAKLEEVDGKLQEIELLQAEIETLRDVKECKACGTKMGKDAQYCKSCGSKIE